MRTAPESRVFNVLAASINRHGEALDLLVHTPEGHIRFRFPPRVADGLLVAPAIPGTYALKRTGKRHENSIKPERRAKYVAAWIAWKTEPNLSQARACARHGIAAANLQAWAYNHRAELDAELTAHLAANKAPVTKPSGKIL